MGDLSVLLEDVDFARLLPDLAGDDLYSGDDLCTGLNSFNTGADADLDSCTTGGADLFSDLSTSCEAFDAAPPDTAPPDSFRGNPNFSFFSEFPVEVVTLFMAVAGSSCRSDNILRMAESEITRGAKTLLINATAGSSPGSRCCCADPAPPPAPCSAPAPAPRSAPDPAPAPAPTPGAETAINEGFADA